MPRPYLQGKPRELAFLSPCVKRFWPLDITHLAPVPFSGDRTSYRHSCPTQGTRRTKLKEHVVCHPASKGLWQIVSDRVEKKSFRLWRSNKILLRRPDLREKEKTLTTICYERSDVAGFRKQCRGEIRLKSLKSRKMIGLGKRANGGIAC